MSYLKFESSDDELRGSAATRVDSYEPLGSIFQFHDC